MDFRKDINGLRAIAVISVILFHFNKNWLPGGFIGVDVFFVISGFLMTSIIFNGVSSGSFSVINFIKRRVKRIVPPLIIVVLASIIFGYMVLEPISYQMAGKHGFDSLLFISNIIYKNESGYFDQESASKIFLHTWSLSVEWQFYIAYPIAIYILSKLFDTKSIHKIILLLFCFSFAASSYASFYIPTDAYYNIYSRAWEMLTGALVFIYPLKLSQSKKIFLECVGITIIIISCFYFTDKTAWPGFSAVVPVFGAYLVMQANNNNSILRSKPIQYIGLWSYSLYLVHWPIISISHNMGYNIGFITYAITVLMVEWISYTVIEKNLKYWYLYSPVYFVTLYICSIVSVDGVSSRVTNSDLKVSPSEFRYKNEGHLGLPSVDEVQYFNANDGFDYVLIGDSHARHFYSYIKDSGLRVASLAIDGCFSTKNFHNEIKYSDRLNSICKKRYETLISFLKQNPKKTLIWSASWSNYDNSSRNESEKDKTNVINEINTLYNDSKTNISKLILVGETPTTKKNAIQCLLSRSLPINRLFNKCDEYEKQEDIVINKRLKYFASKNDGVYFIDPNPAICKENKCIVIDNDKPVYTDNSHFTRKYSGIVGDYIFSKIK